MAFNCLNPDQAVRVEVSYLQPTFSVSYLDVNICAAVTFPDVLGVEVITPTDAVTLATTKVLADTLGVPVDSITYAAQKAIADSVTLSDAVQVFKVYIRNFTDVLNAPDAAVLDIYPSPKQDLATVSDSDALDITKNLSESIGLQDMMDGNIQYLLIKVLNEALAVSDTQTVVFATNKSDNAVLSSSGVLSMQDYCDITYFLEDYVGQTRTFT
jgi:hypothetical protein